MYFLTNLQQLVEAKQQQQQQPSRRVVFLASKLEIRDAGHASFIPPLLLSILKCLIWRNLLNATAAKIKKTKQKKLLTS